MIPENDFHDGVLLGLSFDLERRSIFAKIEAYATRDSRARELFLVTFGNVTSSSFVADMEKIEDNASAGNIASLHRQNDGRSSRIYLTGGLLIVESESVRIDLDAKK